MKKYIWLNYLIFIMFFSPSSHSEYTPNQVRRWVDKEGVSSIIRNMAKTAAKLLPQNIDSETEVFSVAALPDEKEMTFNIRAINYKKEGISDLKELKKIMFNKGSNFVCSSPVSSVLIKERGVKYIYRAHSKSYKFMFTYTIDKAKCNSLN